MRASEVREAIAQAVIAATSDSRARAADGFTWLRAAQEPESVTSRTFMVRLLSGPSKSDLDTCDLFEVVYQLVMFYPAAKDVEDRVAGDMEQLYRPLWNLHSGLSDMESSEPSAPIIDEAQGLVVARVDVAVTYRLDSSIVTG